MAASVDLIQEVLNLRAEVTTLRAELDRWKDRALHEQRIATSIDTDEPAIAPI